jgi:hypothetical protein
VWVGPNGTRTYRVYARADERPYKLDSLEVMARVRTKRTG